VKDNRLQRTFLAMQIIQAGLIDRAVPCSSFFNLGRIFIDAKIPGGEPKSEKHTPPKTKKPT